MGYSVSISNGRPENKALTARAIMMKREQAEKDKKAAEERARLRSASTSS